MDGSNCAYHLRYSITIWPKSAGFQPFDISEDLVRQWESDGIRMLEYACSNSHVQIAFSATPFVSPVLLATRAKGRLYAYLRNQVDGFEGFNRKVAVRSIGDNKTSDISRYLEGQVKNRRFVDPDFQAFIARFTYRSSDNFLTEPGCTKRGRYWYNLHLVLEMDPHSSIYDSGSLERIRSACLSAGERHGHRVASLALLPDHVHMAIRGNIDHCPDEIVKAFKDASVESLGRRIWREGYYTGTFTDYDFGAIRAKLRIPWRGTQSGEG